MDVKRNLSQCPPGKEEDNWEEEMGCDEPRWRSRPTPWGHCSWTGAFVFLSWQILACGCLGRSRHLESESCSVVSDSLPPHGILWARILAWVAFPFSRGSSQPRNQIQVSHIAGRFFTSWAPRAAGQGKFFQLRHFKQPLNIWVSSSPRPSVSTKAAGYRSLGRMTKGMGGGWGRVLPPRHPASSSVEWSLLWTLAFSQKLGKGP